MIDSAIPVTRTCTSSPDIVDACTEEFNTTWLAVLANAMRAAAIPEFNEPPSMHAA